MYLKASSKVQRLFEKVQDTKATNKFQYFKLIQKQLKLVCFTQKVNLICFVLTGTSSNFSTNNLTSV